MKNQEWPAIKKLIRQPPTELSKMILTHFEKLSKEEQSDQNINDLAKILMWTYGGKRYLSFAELEFILQLDKQGPRRLLWSKLRDNWVSIFSLQCPRDYDPDLIDEDNRQSTDSPNIPTLTTKVLSSSGDYFKDTYKNPNGHVEKEEDDEDDDEDDDNDNDDDDDDSSSDSSSFLKKATDDSRFERSDYKAVRSS